MRFILALACVALALAPAIAHGQTTSFTDNYRGYDIWDPQCAVSTKKSPVVGSIYGREPATGGGYPVFVYVHGMMGRHDATEGQRFTEEAARRGFVAGSVSYDSWVLSETNVDGHAACIFRGDSRHSAAGKLCARRKADCSRGVVAMGLSGGGAIVARSKNWNSRVRAAVPLGVSGPDKPLAKASPDGTRALENDRIRILIGQEDLEASSYATMNALTGKSCETPDCIAPDGSGYYVVQHHEVTDGRADHCFFEIGGCKYYFDFEPGALASDTRWSLLGAIDWLRQRTG